MLRHSPQPRLAALAAVLLLIACDDGASLDLEGMSSADGGGGASASGGSTGGTANSGGSAAQSGGSGGGVSNDGPRYDAEGRLLQVRIDEAGLVSTVMPILDARCGSPVCHAGAPAPDKHFKLTMPAAEETGASAAANRDELAGFIDFFEPLQSPILRYGVNQSGDDPQHPIPSATLDADSADFAAIVTWIRGSVVAVEAPDPGTGGAGGSGAGGSGAGGSGGPTSIPCGGLPDTSRSRYDYDAYQTGVDAMLGESCADADCHGTQGSGGSLWLLRARSACDTKWNFYAVQWFVEPLEPAASPILLNPLNPAHGGAEVFHGANDERYTLLRRWVENAWTSDR